MDFEFIKMIMQLLIALGITLSIMILCYKVMENKFNVIAKKKYVQVLERTQISKDNSILVIKVGKKGYVVTSTAQHVDKLSELSEEEISEIEQNRTIHNEEILENYDKLITFSKKEIFRVIDKFKSKEENNETK